LKRTKSDESIEVVYDDANKKLNITLKGNIVRKFITPTWNLPLKKFQPRRSRSTRKSRLQPASLRDIIDDAQSISDNVKFEVSQEKFVVKATGELTSALIELAREATQSSSSM